jgi:hypothetical protein
MPESGQRHGEIDAVLDRRAREHPDVAILLAMRRRDQEIIRNAFGEPTPRRWPRR